MQISPNPATGSVRIQVPGMESESLSFELIHSNGKTTKGILIGNQTERTLDLNGFSSGLYILRLSNGQETRTKKLVIE
jgi:Secretion system C-terminal sorting domain